MAGGGSVSAEGRPPVFKAVGVSLAIASGFFIGISFVLKKKGLLAANIKDGKEAGEGYGYLKNAWWWSGMTLMILGEICNFAAYAFVEAILVTPLGALSVVITAILSSIFLKERLSFIGKIGCFMCIIGSVVIVMNAPAQSSVSTIQDMQRFIVAPGFLTYAGLVIAGCVGIIVWIAPKYGNKSMMVYLTVCSLIGGLSVVATQGLGAAVVAQIGGTPQFNHWFLYVLLVFVAITLLVEIVYLNKALNLFNAALVTPTYYVIFTSATIVTSAILFRGFKGSPASIATVVMGFLQICSGVVLLQLSKSSKNVPDTEIFRGDLDQIRTVAEQSEPESEPKADAIRGTAAIIRRFSVARQQAEVEEARRIHDERMRDVHTPLSLAPGESIEWDGVRRRVTWAGGRGSGPGRRNTLSGHHPPLGMSRIPDEEEAVGVGAGVGEKPQSQQPAPAPGRRRSMSVDEGMRQRVYGDMQDGPEQQHQPQHHHPEGLLGRVRGLFVPRMRSKASLRDDTSELAAATGGSPHRDVRDASGPLSATPPPPPPPTNVSAYDFAAPATPSRRSHSKGGGEYQSVPTLVPSPPSSAAGRRPKDSLRPHSGHSERRQFSFQFLHRHGRSESAGSSTSNADASESGGGGGGARHGLGWKQKLSGGGGGGSGGGGGGGGSGGTGGLGRVKTEEEMLGLVKGDSDANAAASAPSSRSCSSLEKPEIRVVPHEDDDDPDDPDGHHRLGPRWKGKKAWES